MPEIYLWDQWHFDIILRKKTQRVSYRTQLTDLVTDLIGTRMYFTGRQQYGRPVGSCEVSLGADADKAREA